MNIDSPWFDNRTPRDYILSREPVTEITHDIIEDTILNSQIAMRNKDVMGLMSFIALDFKYIGPELVNGKIQMVSGNRDRFQITLCSSLNTSNYDSYTMNIVSVEITSSNTATVELVVSNPSDKLFVGYYGAEISETIIIELYQGRPVINQLEIKM